MCPKPAPSDFTQAVGNISSYAKRETEKLVEICSGISEFKVRL